MSTLRVAQNFSAREDATQLKNAFKGIGCDGSVVVNILAHREASQREDIQQAYETMFSDDLKKRIRSELHGHFKKAVLLWLKTPLERDAKTLRKALKGPIVEHKAAAEIICTRSSSQLRQIKQAYNSAYDTPLEQVIESSTSGEHRKLMLAYIKTTRYDGPEIDEELVQKDAKAIHKFGQKTSVVDVGMLLQIFSERSKAHLVALDSVYFNLYGRQLRRTIKKETSGSFKYTLLTILQCAGNPYQYFAKVLYKAMKGLGTRDTTLIRIVVTRAEIDLQQIMVEYRKNHKKKLTDAVHSETSGNYRSFLLAILGAD